MVWLEDRYYVTWCNSYHGPAIGTGYTFVFEEFVFLENALLPFNRNGVLTSCNGFVYSFGAAPLDLDQPWRVIARGAPYLLSPQTYYECVGDVPNVAFPYAGLYDEPSGRIAIYYGGADTVTALTFARRDEVLDFIRSTSEI